MAKHHKKHREDGGKVEPSVHEEAYAGGGSNVEKEAEEKKHGGKVRHHRKHGGHVDGDHGHRRMDRPGRKRGGSVGADMHPLSSAAKVKDADGHKAEEGNADEGP